MEFIYAKSIKYHQNYFLSINRSLSQTRESNKKYNYLNLKSANEMFYTSSIISEYMPCVRNHELSCKGSFEYEDKYNRVYGTVRRMCAKDSPLHKGKHC